jgi:hypothetical protein
MSNHPKMTAILMSCYVAILVLGCVPETLAFGAPQQSPTRGWTGQLFSHSRRDWIMDIGKIVLPSLAFVGSAFAEDVQAPTSIEMKSFEDPLFTLSVPKSFFTLRRTQKGDLPDAKTGKGRRGSSIFTAGNMAKAEVIAVEVRSARIGSGLIMSVCFSFPMSKALSY